MALDRSWSVVLLIPFVLSDHPNPVRAQTCTAWQEIIPNVSPHPSADWFSAMACDTARNVMVFVTWDGQTWEWDGATWALRTTGVAVGSRPVLTYDSHRGVTVLCNQLGETWEWDGTEWARRDVSGPACSYWGHAMCFDSKRGVTVLYQGDAYQKLKSETWEWDGEQWSQRFVSEEWALEVPYMAFDAARGVAVVVGVTDGNWHVPSSTWEWDGSAWSKKADTPQRIDEIDALIYNSSRSKVLLAKNVECDAGYGCHEFWEWDGHSWEMLPASIRAPIGYRNFADDPTRNVIVSVGLVQQYYESDTWEGDGVTWQIRQTSGSPQPRFWHALTYDSAKQLSVLFGGRGHIPLYLGDTWHWDGATWRFMSSVGPSQREFAVMAYDSLRKVTVLFGGMGRESQVAHCCPLGDTWEWDGQSWVERIVDGPTSRFLHTMAYDSNRGVTVLFGGSETESPLTPLAETWEWDGVSWTDRAATGPAARTWHAMAFDSERGVTVLFGGYTVDFLGDTWEWDGATWALRSETGPAPRVYHAMTYDSDRGVTVLHGGMDSSWNELSDMWAWDGATWRELETSIPTRRWHAMTHDASRKTLVVYGGHQEQRLLGEVWERRPTFPASDAEEDCDVDLFDFASFQRCCCGARPRRERCMRFDADDSHSVRLNDLTTFVTELAGPK